MKTAILKFSINAVLVIVAAVFLPKVGEGIAESKGLGQTFVGSIFIAIVTTIPEVVVSIAAVRIGSSTAKAMPARRSAILGRLSR